MEKRFSSNSFWLLLGGAIPFLAYLLTMPTDLTLGIFGSDNGELITASLTNGIPHPSGYPTWLLASKAFGWLPIGRTLAHRYNLFSAVCMSLSMLILTFACRLTLPTKNYFAPLAAVLAIAFTLTVWSQAVIAEVYALNALMVSFGIYLLAKISAEGLSTRRIRLLGLACGLAITTHLTSILLLPAVGLVLIIGCLQRVEITDTPSAPRNQRTTENGQLGIMAFASCILHLAYSFIFGLTPFLLFFWRANNSSPVMWGDSSTLAGWWWLVSGALYRPNVFALSAGEIFTRIQSTLLSNPINLIPLLMPLGAIVGITLKEQSIDNANNQLSMNSPPTYRIPITLTLTAALYTLYALSYNTTDWRIFLIPANLCLAIPLTTGLACLNLKQWSLALPLLLFALNLPILLNGRIDDTRQQAEAIFAQAPADAILLTDGRDETIFPMWYFRYAENIRLDTLIVDQNLFAFDWYRDRLAMQHPEIQAVAIDDLSAFKQQNSEQRPICETSLHPFALSCTDG